MTRESSLGGWPFWASVVLHLVGLGAVSAVAATSTATPPPLVPIELVRVAKPALPPEIYAPRVVLDFRLTDRDGKVVSAGYHDLGDPLYLTRAVTLSADPLRYEKNLLLQWLQKEVASRPRRRRSHEVTPASSPRLKCYS